MKNHLSLFLSLLFLFSCGNQPNARKINFPGTTETVYCFEGQNEDEYYLLRCYVEKETILGVMEFRLENGEQRLGTIEGRLEGDTLFADLSLQNEAFFINREIAFLLTDKGLAEGKGAMEKKGDKMVFTDPAALTFGQDMILQPKDCPEK